MSGRPIDETPARAVPTAAVLLALSVTVPVVLFLLGQVEIALILLALGVFGWPALAFLVWPRHPRIRD